MCSRCVFVPLETAASSHSRLQSGSMRAKMHPQKSTMSSQACRTSTIPRTDQALTPGKAALPLSISGSPYPEAADTICSCDGVIQGSSKGSAPTELAQQTSHCRFCREPPTVPSPLSIKRDEGQPRMEISHLIIPLFSTLPDLPGTP